INFLEELVKLLCAFFGRIITREAREMRIYFIKRDPVTSVISSARPKDCLAARESFSHHFRYFPNSEVFVGISYIKFLIMNGLFWSLQYASIRSAYIFNMDQRPPRHPVADHFNDPGGPRQPG